MKLFYSAMILAILFLGAGCKQKEQSMERQYTIEKIQMGDVGPVRIVQLYADGFEQLSVKEKIFVYYLYQAAIAGRDIAIDQRHRDALEIRTLMEAVYTHPKGIDPKVAAQIQTYTKLFWVNNCQYDNITTRKFVPECSFDDFKKAVLTAQANGAIPSGSGESVERMLDRLRPSLFDADYEPVQTNKTPGVDMIAASANNLYRGTTYPEVDTWAKSGSEKNSLNSKVIKEKGKLVELVYRSGDRYHGGTVAPGMYASDLLAVNYYLSKARDNAVTSNQAETIAKLIRYYETGDLNDWRAFNISWVKDVESRIDFIHGFIEVYLDARGAKGQFESVIYFADPKLTETIQKIGAEAQYFEDRTPWDEQYKKKDVKPLKASVINVVVETGDAGPVSAIGINLPNEQDIRERYGSKSVTLNNIVDAYDKSGGKDILKEFAFDEQEVALDLQYGSLADNLHTALHEVLGHASGKVSPNLKTDPQHALPGYYSTLEEARADLVAMWHIWDDKLIELGALPNKDVVKALYNKEVRNAALTQLQRVPKGHDQLEEDHMKDRQLIVHWLWKNAHCIEQTSKNGKTYFRVTDYQKMREGVGRLLSEIMRIKAEGDFAAAKHLIDSYGLKIDTTLRDEVLERMEKLDRAVYTGFVMPKLEPVLNSANEISDVKVTYPLDLAQQMLEYSAFTTKEKELRGKELMK